MTSWFTLTENLGWADDLPTGARELPFRYAHLSAAVSEMEQWTRWSDQGLISIDTVDKEPAFRYVDVAAFARWTTCRRCGPNPGVLLGKALFGFDYDDRRMLAFSHSEWVDYTSDGDGLGTALATLCLAIGDAPPRTDLSVELTTEIAWFMARGALVLQWMDWDRASRLDSTNAFPVMPICRECLQMATRRIAMGKGLDQGVAEAWRKSLRRAIYDVQNDTVLNRCIRAELALERAQQSAAAQESATSAPTTPL
jgi:hypothetical protein